MSRLLDRLNEMLRDLRQRIMEFDRRQAQQAWPKIRIYDKSSLRAPTPKDLQEERKALEKTIKQLDKIFNELEGIPGIDYVNRGKGLVDPDSNSKGVVHQSFIYKSMTSELVKAKEQLRDMSLERRLEKGYFIRIRESGR